MNNKTAFDAEEYNKKITATVPYYNEFYEQITRTVRLLNINGAYDWMSGAQRVLLRKIKYR